MKHKIGDQVKIKSIDWYISNRDENKEVNVDGYADGFAFSMSRYCGDTAYIVNIETIDRNSFYRLDVDDGEWRWFDFMFDDSKLKEIIIPDGWEIDNINDNKIILKPIKKPFIKTYQECYKNLESITHISFGIPSGMNKAMIALQKLLICREVYRQGWKPNWSDDTTKYVINVEGNSITTNRYKNINKVLAFQSEEVRDEFLKNFIDLIRDAIEFI